MVIGSEMGMYPKLSQCSPIRAHSDVSLEHLKEICPFPIEHKLGMMQTWSCRPSSLQELLFENRADKVESNMEEWRELSS